MRHLPRKADASVRPRLAEKLRPRDLSFAQIVQSIERGIERWHARNEVGAAYGAGEWGPEPGPGVPRPEGPACSSWSGERDGRRLTRSLGHREWVRAKRQADEFAAGFVGPDLNGKATSRAGAGHAGGAS